VNNLWNNSLFKGSSFSDSKEEEFLQRGHQNCGDGAINHAHSWCSLSVAADIQTGDTPQISPLLAVLKFLSQLC
jgi:hypothetical protein